MENQKDPIIEALQLAVRRLMRLVIVLSILIVLIPLFVLNLTAITDYLKSVGDEDLIPQTVDSTALVTTETAETSMYVLHGFCHIGLLGQKKMRFVTYCAFV
jgi:hypothetical protein